MGITYEKTGIFGFGKTIVKHFCDKCGADVTNSEKFFNPNPPTSNFFCRECALKLGISLLPHDWPTDPALAANSASYSWHWMTDSVDKKQKFIKHCYKCKGLLVATKEGSELKRFYYTVGKNYPLETEPKCSAHLEELLHGHPKKRWDCTHNFIQVATSRISEKEARGLEQQLRQSAANDIFGAIDFEAAAYGRRYIWCSKCGLFYDLPKYREKELKKTGINTDWYV